MVITPALDPGGLVHRARGDDDPHAPVSVTGHGPAPSIHQERDQETRLGDILINTNFQMKKVYHALEEGRLPGAGLTQSPEYRPALLMPV